MKPESVSPSPLAREIYRKLVKHVTAGEVSITYGQLAASVSSKIPVHPRSSKLHAALTEVTVACRARGLPNLPAIVWRAGGKHPSDGFFKIAYPRARSFERQLESWMGDHALVITYDQAWPSSL
jgi:hypothetical protein